MKTYIYAWMSIIALALVFSGCREEDPGPKQDDLRSFAEVDFDRIEVADAFDVTIQQGTIFSIVVKGDRRNLDDLNVYKNGNTLRVKYDNYHKRQYTSYVTITMPVIKGIDFSGAVDGRVYGFSESVSRFDLSLSGASTGQFEIVADEVYLWLAGASEARFTGVGKKLDASISGASDLQAVTYPVDEAKVSVTGASKARLSVNQKLTGTAGGASEVTYKGDPVVDLDSSGASTVRKD
jgi:Putative auto-transporter adhesin, head GIN domain